MALGNIDPKQFWEGKIVGWEDGRYRQGEGEPGLLNRVADWSSDSLRFRLQSSAELIIPHVEGKRVVDIGCGSGLLGPPLIAAGAAHYHGIDIAESAVERAKTLAESRGVANRCTFEVGVVDQLGPLDADIVVSLGLTDWLTDQELDHLWKIGGSAHFLHAISRRRNTPAQLLHKAYCYLAYGYKTGGYVPRYFDPQAIAAIALRHHPGPVRLWTHRRLTFGGYVTSLPVGDLVASR